MGLAEVPPVCFHGSGWGELDLLGSTPDSGGNWTDSGRANEDRQLKHRGEGDTRPVPAPPELVEILHRHIATFPTSPDGRLFVSRIGRAGVPLPPPFSKPLSMGTAYRVWDAPVPLPSPMLSTPRRWQNARTICATRRSQRG